MGVKKARVINIKCQIEVNMQRVDKSKTIQPSSEELGNKLKRVRDEKDEGTSYSVMLLASELS